jgi:hypothetical protein
VSEEKVAPIEAVFLGLDPAKHTSGAALLAPDYGNPMLGEEEHPFEGSYALLEYGKVECQSERERFVESALGTAMEMGLPLVVVAEEWDPPRHKKVRLPGNQLGVLLDPKWTYQTVLGIGEGWGRWMAELESASVFMVEEEEMPPLLIERVTPNDWRDGLFGPRRAKDTTALKVTAQRYFEGVFGINASDDISEAACIALWGTTSPTVLSAVEGWVKLMKAKEKAKKTKNQQKAQRRRRAS